MQQASLAAAFPAFWSSWPSTGATVQFAYFFASSCRPPTLLPCAFGQRVALNAFNSPTSNFEFVVL
jgi:hypothetical protein